MAKTATNVQLTARDLEILTFVDMLPLTADEVLRLSTTFDQPFRSLRLVQRRLQALRRAGLLVSRPYATASLGRSPHYVQLTRQGYRVLYGADAPLPRRRYFLPIADARHRHTRALSQFLVHLMVTAQRRGFQLCHFARENTVRIETAIGSLYPDAAFQLVSPERRGYNFVLELDNGTERVRSNRDAESIEQKVRTYDRHQDNLPAYDRSRYVALFVTTRSHQRLEHMLQTAAAVMSNPDRTLFLGTSLQRFLDIDDPFGVPCLLDQHLRPRFLIPDRDRRHQNPDHRRAGQHDGMLPSPPRRQALSASHAP